MNDGQTKIAVGIVSVAVLLLVIGVIRALQPKAHYMPADPSRPVRPTATAASAGGPVTAEQMMQYMDTDGDGYITMGEAPEELKEGFSFIDTNADGGIDVKEAQVMADYNNNPQSAQSAAAGPMTAEQMMSYMDTDGDGMITMAEAPEELKEGFSFIDTNGDGGIDVQEAQVMADYANNEQ